MKRVRPIDPLQRLREFVRRHPTQRAAAQHLGISASYLTDLLYQRRLLSRRVLDGLGLTRIVAEVDK